MSKIDLKTRTSLIISESDSDNIENLKRNKQLIKMNCVIFKTILSLIAREEEEFNKIYDFNGKENIVYSENGLISIPKCYEIDKIIFNNNTNTCYEHVPIKLTYEHKNSTGFLTKDNIIENSAKKKLFKCKKLASHQRKSCS